VKQGQVFAKSGGEPGTPGSGNITTGPHLHMEVYLKESVIDPLRYLDMTVFPEEWVTKKYRYKYYLDRLARDPETNWKDLKKSIGLFYIEGDTEIERQQKLIEEYAGKDFSDWETWATYSIE